MDVSKFKAPNHWPAEARAFAHDAVAEIQELKVALRQAITHLLGLQGDLKSAQVEIQELKAKLGTNSSNSHQPPSKDPPGTPSRETKPTGRPQGAQKGHRGAGRSLFPAERINHIREVFPAQCPISGRELRPEDLVSLSVKRVHQVDLPADIRLEVTEFRLHTCLCPCGCGKTVSALMPTDAGNTAMGFRLKSLITLLATRFRLSKGLIQELLIDVFGPDATFSTGCLSEAETEMGEALAKPYVDAKAAIQQAPAVHVDETSWFMKHKIHWLWLAANKTLAVFAIDPERSRKAFGRLLGTFEGFVISDRYSAYAHLPSSARQLCWAHLIRDFRRLVDRHAGAERVSQLALDEIQTMFVLWNLHLDGEIDLPTLRKEMVTIRARFGRLLKRGETSPDTKAAHLCQNLRKWWPSLWTFLRRPDILQPTNNLAEQGIRHPVIGRALSLGSQSDRGLRFTERMLTAVATFRRQGRRILDFLQQSLLAFRRVGQFPTLVPQPSG